MKNRMTKNNVHTLAYLVTLFLFVSVTSNVYASVSQVNVNVPGPLIITILGSNPVTLPIGGTYTDAGATVLDTSNGTVPVNVISNNVNTLVAGSYSVVYRAVDIAGSVEMATRTVNIITPTTRRRAQSPDITAVSVDVGGDTDILPVDTTEEPVIQKSDLPINFCFTKNLNSNKSDPDVKNLQIFLNNLGFFVTSGGSENYNYGKETINAVKLFQAQGVIVPFMPFNSITVTGNFDEATRMKANDILGCNVITASTSTGLGGEAITTLGASLATTTVVSNTVPPVIATNTLNQTSTTKAESTTTTNISKSNIKTQEATSSVKVSEIANKNIFQKFIVYIISVSSNFAKVFKSLFSF